MANKVDVEAIRKAGQKLDAADGPITYLQNVQKLLEGVKLSSMALTLFGVSTVSAHNDSVDGHVKNIKTGVEHLHKAAAQLEQSAKNWEKSDQPWVVK
jgi:TctA family transporter